MPHTPAIRLRSAVALLGRYPALAGVDLDVRTAEVVLVSGPNGAGKSTLLRVLAGLVPLAGGEARVMGFDLGEDRRAVRAQVAYVGHETLCYEDLTARENLRFHARLSGRPVDASDAALERVGLHRRADVPHRLLSAGQRRRLALGAALVRDARLLLLDEPHAGLDAEGRRILDDAVRAAKSEGNTVVIASHERERALALADREVTMAGGTLADGVVAAESQGQTGPVAAPEAVVPR